VSGGRGTRSDGTSERAERGDGRLYQQGRYAEALPKAREALALRKQVLGPENPDVAQNLVNLAWVYRKQNQHATAQPLFTRQAERLERVAHLALKILVVHVEQANVLRRPTRVGLADASEDRLDDLLPQDYSNSASNT
jgi:Tfp pilus assembly protein PilF